jgi:hypothetical protein
LIEKSKKSTDDQVLEELENIKAISPSGKRPFGGKKEKEEPPRRYHEANVFRRQKHAPELVML